MSEKKLELLAPAGSFETFKAELVQSNDLEKAYFTSYKDE